MKRSLAVLVLVSLTACPVGPKDEEGTDDAARETKGKGTETGAEPKPQV